MTQVQAETGLVKQFDFNFLHWSLEVNKIFDFESKLEEHRLSSTEMRNPNDSINVIKINNITMYFRIIIVYILFINNITYVRLFG